MTKNKAKTKKPKPLERHKLLLKRISENLGKGMSLGEAMRDVGYSESYSKSPNQIKDTRSWDTLLKEELPDNVLIERLGVLLKAKQVEKFIFPSRMKDEEIIESVKDAGFKVITIRPSPIGKMAFYSIENTKAIDNGLTHAFKLKGKYEPEEFNLKFNSYTKEQLIDVIMAKIAKKK